MLIASIDTETTSMKGKVCEFGETIFRVTKDGDFKVIDSRGSMINPEEPISFEAMAIHGVTEEDVKSAPKIERVLKDHSLEGKQYVFAHNLSYEKEVLPEQYFPENVRQICTLKLARVLYEVGEVESHKLGVLYYQWGLYKDERLNDHSIHLHSAQSDTLVNGLVLEYMLKDKGLTLDEAWEMLYDVKTCKGGKKYKNEKWEDVIKKDYDYIQYTVNQEKIEDEEELGYLVELLSEYSHLKEEQMDVVGFGKHKGSSWRELVKNDSGYVTWCLNNLEWRCEDVKKYVQSLMK